METYRVHLTKALTDDEFFAAKKHLKQSRNQVCVYTPDNTAFSASFLLNPNDQQVFAFTCAQGYPEDILHNLVVDFLVYCIGILPVPKYKVGKLAL